MSQVAVKIEVDTESLIEAYPSGSTSPIANASNYIAMSIVEGTSSTSHVTQSGTANLAMTVTPKTDIRFYGVPKQSGVGASVKLVEKDSQGHKAKYQPTRTIVNGAFFYDGQGHATGTTVDSTQTSQAYNFILQVDGYSFTFTWDPYLAVGSS